MLLFLSLILNQRLLRCLWRFLKCQTNPSLNPPTAPTAFGRKPRLFHKAGSALQGLAQSPAVPRPASRLVPLGLSPVSPPGSPFPLSFPADSYSHCRAPQGIPELGRPSSPCTTLFYHRGRMERWVRGGALAPDCLGFNQAPVTLGKLLNFSRLHFCIYKMGLIIKAPTSGAVVLISGVNISNLLRTVPAYLKA